MSVGPKLGLSLSQEWPGCFHQASAGALDAAEPFNALFLVFPPSLSSRLFGWELLSCLHSASNFLLLFCSSSFLQDLMKRSFLDVPDDTGFTRSRSSLSLSLIFPTIRSTFVLFFSFSFSSPFSWPRSRSSWSLCNSGRTFQLGTLEDGEWVGEKEKKVSCNITLASPEGKRHLGLHYSRAFSSKTHICKHIFISNSQAVTNTLIPIEKQECESPGLPWTKIKPGFPPRAQGCLQAAHQLHWTGYHRSPLPSMNRPRVCHIKNLEWQNTHHILINSEYFWWHVFQAGHRSNC